MLKFNRHENGRNTAAIFYLSVYFMRLSIARKVWQYH
ncbi:hypothetical protein STM14_5315 [Salmonella enterica subsp. enterica serovar Typhimurium str. 14028S]|uniref:Uncharacterized protein n=2 Tax=Salmonella enterica I TaxID=59201 RepID=A0A0F6BAU8_SALT1|nr:hypothetical protein SPAB_05570 [Salmonella enterica subsp. enterica serovar Paratyphi B str. SPB7]ACY91650.1 hypothetical protein STM14_5315 [Salmonella enterica subsp. enterica serovar Typhimurium str. 14028S]